MKVAFRILGSILILMICYFLYQIQLGAIPFLIMSFVLFYFVYRLIMPTSVKKNKKNESCEESTAVDVKTREK